MPQIKDSVVKSSKRDYFHTLAAWVAVRHKTCIYDADMRPLTLLASREGHQAGGLTTDWVT